jgi:hypothetical protein
MKKKQFIACKILAVCLYAFFVVSCSKTDALLDNALVPNAPSMSLEATTALNTPLKLDK